MVGGFRFVLTRSIRGGGLGFVAGAVSRVVVAAGRGGRSKQHYLDNNYYY